MPRRVLDGIAGSSPKLEQWLPSVVMAFRTAGGVLNALTQRDNDAGEVSNDAKAVQREFQTVIEFYAKLNNVPVQGLPKSGWRNRAMFLLVFVMLLAPAFAWAQTDGFISLMPKADLSEFWSAAASPEGTWSLEKGVIAAKGNPMGVLRSNKKYKNFVLRVELRFKKEGWTKAPAEWPNAGVFIFASDETRERYPHWPRSFVEVQGHYGEIASAFGGKLKGAIRYEVVPPDQHGPFGEWDRLEITTNNGSVKVKLNGKPVNEGNGADPPEGYICLQSEGWPVYYRNVGIKVLPGLSPASSTSESLI